MSRVFNGTTDIITLNPSASLDSANTKFTIMSWVYPTNSTASSPLSIGDLAFVFANNFGANELSAQVAGTTGSATSQASANSLSANVWTHVAASYDNTGDRKIHLFVNGIEVVYVQQTTLIGTQTSRVGSSIGIGADLAQASPYTGRIAEFQLYNTILTAAQITTAMNAIVPLPASLAAYLHLCGTASPEPDVSGKGNVGILTGTIQGPNSPGFNCSAQPVYSIPDCRNFGNFPNAGRNINGTSTFDVDAHPSYTPPVDSRSSKPVNSDVSLPQNSRTPGTFGPGV